LNTRLQLRRGSMILLRIHWKTNWYISPQLHTSIASFFANCQNLMWCRLLFIIACSTSVSFWKLHKNNFTVGPISYVYWLTFDLLHEAPFRFFNTACCPFASKGLSNHTTFGRIRTGVIIPLADWKIRFLYSRSQVHLGSTSAFTNQKIPTKSRDANPFHTRLLAGITREWRRSRRKCRPWRWRRTTSWTDAMPWKWYDSPFI